MTISIIIVLFIILFYKPIKHGIIDGWNGSTKYRALYDTDYVLQLEQLEQLKEENLAQLEKLENELAMLEYNIKNRDIITVQLENELKTCNNIKRSQLIRSKLITLNKQGFKDRERINKIKDKIRELE